MVPPREQWCVQIEVTNACLRKCSNCTRLVAHCREPFFMTLPDFRRALEAVADFPTQSEPDRFGRRKVVGIIGGEPLLHPDWPILVDEMVRAIPEPSHRGLWIGRSLTATERATVHRLLGPQPTTTVEPVPRGAGGYLNQNLHKRGMCCHQPVLVAVQDVIHDEASMWKLIEECPLQREWSSAITPKGFFFCEVAAAFDMIFDGPGGVPVTPGCWRHDIADYRDQVERWCPRCGVCLPLEPRHDYERVDDISESNLEVLLRLGSPRVLADEIVLFDPNKWTPPEDWRPLKYLR